MTMAERSGVAERLVQMASEILTRNRDYPLAYIKVKTYLLFEISLISSILLHRFSAPSLGTYFLEEPRNNIGP